MPNVTDGYVLKSARSAPANARSTDGADSGVSRAHYNFPGSFIVPGDFVELAADQYRAAVLLNPSQTTHEYLLWAANSSNLAVLEDPTWAITDGVGYIPSGTLTVTDAVYGTRSDGTDRIIVTDNGGRAIAGVLSITIIRGDTGAELVTSTFTVNAQSGVVTLDAGDIATLGGGLSRTRGDAIQLVSYYLAAQRFWWSRNDDQTTRFGWDGAVQRWVPLRGTPPQSVGVLTPTGTYTLTPRPTRYAIGTYLPGDINTPDAYASVRIGRIPDAIYGTPVRVLVVTDDQAADPGFVFPSNTDAIVGNPGGALVFAPAFSSANAGQPIWYTPDTFPEVLASGDVGALSDDLFITPVPDRGEYPLIRIGSRSYLTAIGVDNDANLIALPVAEGEVGYSRTTGKLKFNATDVAKSNPDDSGFDILYLGAHVFYDGISLTERPIRTRDPIALIDVGGDLYVPPSTIGVSGVDFVPDGTGTVPNNTAIPSTRPNGCGLVRSVGSFGDVVVFGRTAAIETIEVVEFESDIPTFSFVIPKGKAFIARELGASGSKVAIGLADRVRFNGEQLYFMQCEVQPAQYTNLVRIGSQRRGPFTLYGDEVLAFEIDGNPYLWVATTLAPPPGGASYDAETVASSIAAVVAGSGSVYALRGRVWIESTGSITIGAGSITSGAFPDRDLSGCAVLGFLPGWHVENATDNWLPDAGLAYGVNRSPQNLDRTGSNADFRATYRITDAVVTASVGASPVVTFTSPPLEDVAGYDVGVFFTLTDGLFIRALRPYEDVVYRFGQNRMIWAEQRTVVQSITARTDTLPLGQTGVFGESMHPAVGDGFGLYLSPTGVIRNRLIEGVDYTLPSDGAPGIAELISVVGGVKATGYKGAFSSGGVTFTDVDATFITLGVTAGWRLKLISGDETTLGSYEVLSVASETTLTIRSESPFNASGAVVAWELYEGFPRSVFDPTVMVDVVSTTFSPLQSDTFVARILTPMGATPATPAEQSTNRLRANVTPGREVSIRFGGGVSDPAITPLALSNVQCGYVLDSVISIPDVADTHFIEGAFAIAIGGDVYTNSATTLIPVTVFTSGLVGNVIEYGQPGSGAIEGLLNLGAGVSTTHVGARIYYAPQFRDPTLMGVGDAEFSPYTGEINLSALDMATYGGVSAYWVETQIPTTDVQLGPIQGTVFFKRPLKAYQIVEVSYSRANTDGTRYINPATGLPVDVVEQLPLYVRMETATRIDARTYAFNPTGRAIRGDIEASVWVGSRLVTTGNIPKATVDSVTSRITFRDDVNLVALVRINYAVTQAFGGEQSYTVSAPPVWRAPLIIPKNADTFTVLGDRTQELIFGAVLTVGTVCFYISGVAYAAQTGTTTVTVYPPAPVEAGTRDPGANSPATVTSVAVALSVDGIPANGNAGFLLPVTASYIPVDLGQTAITIAGDITAYARSGHLLEIGGYPILITGSTLSADGIYTTITVGTPFQRGFDPTNDAVRISVRPIYSVGQRVLEPIGPIVDSGYELVRYTAGSPGDTLVPTVDYSVDVATGGVTLLTSAPPILPEDRFSFSYTRRVGVAPFTVDDRVVYPTYSAGYVYASTPTEDNGYLNATLTATYTFRSPDTFYVRAVSMVDWMGEVLQKAALDVAAQTPHGGPNLTIQPPQNNWMFGTAPNTTAIRELGDRDRAARRFIALYDGFVRSFEQVLETIDGRVIGDRDGKFRFWVGMGVAYAPPGYEDEITGSLNPRNIWSMVFEQTNGSFGVAFSDPLVNPYTATQNPTTLVVSGDPPDPDTGAYLFGLQRQFILNDMDDRVVVGSDGVRMSIGTPDLPLFYVSPDYRALWEPSSMSRLFPESTVAFGTTYPGIGFDRDAGDAGRYAFATVVPPAPGQYLPRVASTFFKEILPVQNPALGVISNVQSASVRKRLPRGRVWAYSPTGFPGMDAVCVAAGLPDPNFTGNPRPAAIITPLELSAFPISPQTGLPDVSQLVAGGGSLFDLTTGDVPLSTPPWKSVNLALNIRPQISYGVPNGTTYRVGYVGSIISSILGSLPISPSYPGVFVGEMYGGCIVTFAQETGITIRDASEIAVIGEGDPGDTLPFDMAYGDTLFITPPTGTDNAGTTDPPPINESSSMATNSPTYRTGVDVGVANRRGSFRDISLPSITDPSPLPLKEITGQNPVPPITCIEANVEFTNGDVAPLAFPAMQGLETNDAGDYGIPYLSIPNTELDRLVNAASAFTTILETDSPIPNAVYPDEIVADAETYATVTGSYPPAAIVAPSVDFVPGVYVPHSGVGPVSEFDLILIETGNASLSGAQGAEGILQVGSVTGQTIEPPRFVAPTRSGDRIRYRASNAMTHVSDTGLSGVVVAESGGIETTFDISSVGGLFLNNGTVATVAGGLNNILNPVSNPFPNGNLITIEILDRNTQTIVETITIDGDTVTGGLGSVVIGSSATATDKVLTVPAVGFVDFAALGGVSPGPTAAFDFKISIDTFNAASAYTQGSYTASIGTDRLTFAEALDLRTAPERGTVYLSSAIPMEFRLVVDRVTASGNPSTVNRMGGTHLTFLNRDAMNPGFVGQFDTGTGIGSVQSNGFEGFGNVPLTITGMYRISAMPSSAWNQTSRILGGTGDVYDDADSIVNVVPSNGGITNVEPGDILVIRASSIGDAAVTAGTYIVRHAVDPNMGAYRELDAQITVGTANGWLRVGLPTIVSTAPLEITLSGVRVVLHSPSGYDWDSNGRIYVFPDGASNLSTVVSMDYSSFVVNGDGTATFTLITGTATDATGVAVVDATFMAQATVGVFVSGARYIPIGQFTPDMPENNTVADPLGTVHGFVTVTTLNRIIDPTTTVTTFTGASLVDANGIGGYPATPPSPGDLAVLGTDGGTFSPADAGVFQSNPDTPVYREVPVFLDFRGLFSPLSAWSTTTHGASAFSVRCLAPGDVIQTSGFRAMGGVFVEPSSPSRDTAGSPPDLGDGTPKVVDASHSLPNGSVGIPNPSIHGASPESVEFEIRRVRRWHQVLDGIGDSLGPLRFAYEIRQGTIDTYNGSTRTLTAQGSGTQLGGFNVPDVNVNSGDTVRLLDANGVVVDQAEISSVVDATTLKLRAPGLQQTTPTTGQSFEIYLKQAPVPHNQSNEQLLEMITDRVVLDRVADPSATPVEQGGGYVLTANELLDAGASFDDVRVGDIVIVDPAGALAGATGPANPIEYGVRPVGDTAVPGRGAFVAGAPSEFDDNRGFYRVVGLGVGSITVSGATAFSGVAGSDVVFGASGQEYAVLPTIHGSALGDEGQMDLRVTHFANGANSYAGTTASIAPFSYRIIRPVGTVSNDTVDLILFIRERMLSWIEDVRHAFDATKQGSYFVFQRDEHISDVGNPTDPTDGLGVPSNLYITSLSGLVNVSPFANTSDCLSILDRRYWCLDVRLDTESPIDNPGEPYASFESDNSSGGTYVVGSGRPVEPDRIGDVLDRTDRLRDLRFSWVRYRADRVRGTLAAMNRLSADRDTARRAAKDLANMAESEDGVE